MPDDKKPKAKVRDGFFSSMYHSFIKNDLDTIHDNIVNEVVVPTISGMIIDTVTSAVSMLFGGKPSRVGSIASGIRRTSYSGNYPVVVNSNNISNRRDRRGPVEMRHFNASNYVIHSREDAEATYIDLIDQVNTFGFVTVGEFLDSIGITPDQTTYNYGWRTMDGVQIVSVYDGYILTLPKPIFDDSRKG